MKKSTNVILIFSTIFIIVGIITTIIALLLGAKFYDYKLDNFNQIYEDNISSININIEAGEVIVKEGDSFKIEASNIIESKLKSEVNDNTWEIEYLQFKNFFYNLLNNSFSFNSKITIYIPSDTIIDKFDIDLGAGKGLIKKLSAKDIKVNVGTGSLIINDLYSEKSSIDCGVGNVDISGRMIGYNKIDNGVGSINLNLIGNEKDYNYRYDIGIGEVKLNNIKYASDDNYINNNANNDFNIDCGVGSIEINIKE